MDKFLQKEIRSHYQNESYKADVIDMIEKDEELIKKCYDKMDEVFYIYHKKWQNTLE